MNEEKANMAIQAVDMAKEDPRWQEKRIDAMARRFRERSNCECLVEVVHELYELDDRRRELKNAVRCILLTRQVELKNPRSYTKRQEAYIKDAVRRRIPVKDMAFALQKSPKAVMGKIERMGLK